MADEITITLRFDAIKAAANLEVARRFEGKTFTLNGANYDAGKQSIGFAAHAQVPVPNVGTAGYAIFFNADPTNYVEVGRDTVGNGTGTFWPFAKLGPGKFALVPLSSDLIFAKANTAAVALEFFVLED